MSRLSSLQDESSMPSLVLVGLQSIYKLTARKHKQLRQECEQLITALQADDAAQQQSIQAQAAASTSPSSPQPSYITDTDADKYFLPFKLACESDNSRIIAAALNSIEKLIAYGYLDGASYADAEIYPVKKRDGDEKDAAAKDAKDRDDKKDATKKPDAPTPGSAAGSSSSSPPGSDSRRLISVIIDTIHLCSFNKDREVQLQALKAVLTAVTSVSCQVHGQPLVTATYSVWNIYLQAVDDTIKTTAKATLTQIFNLAFQRMESFAVQLKQLEQSAALSAAVAGDDGGKPQTAAEKDRKRGRDRDRDKPKDATDNSERKDEEKVQEEKERAAAGDDTAAATLAAHRVDDEEKIMSPRQSDAGDTAPSTSESAATSAAGSVVAPTARRDVVADVVSPVSPSGSSSPSPSPAVSPPPPERPPPGKRGYCVVCSKPANHYCLQSRDSVCSMECKLINLQRRDRKSTIATDVQKKIQAKFSILQTDAYLLLRALIRISKKPLPSPHEPSAVDSKLLSLELLLSIMRSPGPTFRTATQFVQYVKVEVVDSILKNSDASIDTLFSLSSSLFVALVRHFKAHLHKIIGPVLDSIYLPYISNANSSYPIKHASLLVLKQICADSSTIVELFLNYDCDIGSFNTFQKIATTLEKTVQGSYFAAADGLTELEESRLKMMGLEALVETMKSLVDWTKRGEEWELKLMQQAASASANGSAKKADDTADDEGGSPRSASPTSASSSSRFGVSSRTASSSSPTSTTPPAEDDDPRSAAQEDTYVAASSTSSTFSSQFHHLRQQKQKLDTGILRFNMKPKKGLQYLFEHHLLEPTPDSVAAFFHANGALDKTQVGDYMGEDVDFNKKVLYAYVDQMDFRGLAFDDGIRAFVSGFRLPGEAQKIDRMMEKWASQYHLHNPGMFNSADTAYVLAYSVILLNSDAHNPQVKNRMTKEEFFRNCRGIDDGKDINPAFLSDIYDRITTNEIKMKDDPYRAGGGLLKADDGMTGAKRVNAFMKESQQMVKKTQDLIKSIGGGAVKDKRALVDQAADEQQPGRGQEGAGKSGGKDGKSASEKPFYLAQDSDWQACGAMFEILWYPSLATFSVLLEENESEAMINLCLDGYKYAIRISNALNMETSRLAFVTSLKKFTLLGSSKEMRNKNIHAVKMLLHLVNTEGNYLKESWAEVLMCISEVERLHLIATSNKPTVDLFVGESQVKLPSATFAAPAPTQQQAAGKEKNREVDSVNAGKLLIDVALIERVFINSANLNGDAIVDFANALRAVSEHELSSSPPRVFSLQKIVEITYYNMQRIRLVWSKIWAILSDFFIKAGCHPNLGVSLYAIDSLRQLAMKFLEKDELSTFSYQKQFFRPFELIMAQNASVEARELIVQCMSRMILARKNNIKSGWRAVFVVLAIAGQQQHAPLVQSSADLLSAIMEQHFPLITEIDTMDECINSLVAFGAQKHFTEISLQAIHYLTLCATHMGAIPQHPVDGTRSAASTPRRRGSSSASGAPLVNSQLSVALATDTDALSSTGGSTHSQPEQPHASAATAAAATAAGHGTYYSMSAPPTPANASFGVVLPHPVVSQAHLLKVWFLLLTGLSRLVADSRSDVRHLALTTLFAILNENGQVFSASTWRAIFHGVLLPIFDDVGADEAHDSPSISAPSSTLLSSSSSTNGSAMSADGSDDGQSSWLQTTCYDALSASVQLFSRFYLTTHFLLPDIVRLLAGLIQQENEELAKIGTDCLGLLMKDGAAQWTVGSTWIVLEEVMALVKRTLPTPLLSPKVRQLLGLPPKPGHASPAEAGRREERKAKPAEQADVDRPEQRKQSLLEERKETETPRSPSFSDRTSDVVSASVGDFSPLSETVRSRTSSVQSGHGGGGPVSLSFSFPLIHTRCKVQLLLLHALYETLERCFPQRDAIVKAWLTPPSAHGRDAGHFRRPSDLSPEHARNAIPSLSRESSTSNGTNAAPSSQHAEPSTTSTEVAGTIGGSADAAAPSVLRGQSASSSSAMPPAAPAVRVSVSPPDSRYHRREDHRIFGRFLPSHLLYALSIFSVTLSFSHDFNADVPLRKKLYQAGFIIEQAGRLPQLFELEARVTRFAWTSMFRLWKEGGAASDVLQDSERDVEELSSVRSGQEVDVMSSTAAVSIMSAPSTLEPASAYHSAVVLSYHRLSLLSTRVLTEYLTKTQGGQLVSLQHVDELVAAMVDSYASLRLELFRCDVDVLVPLFGELCEWGSVQVRAAVRRWLQGRGLQLCRIAFTARHDLQDDDDDDDGDEDDGEDENDDANPLQQQPAAPGSAEQTHVVGEGQLVAQPAQQ